MRSLVGQEAYLSGQGAGPGGPYLCLPRVGGAGFTAAAHQRRSLSGARLAGLQDPVAAIRWEAGWPAGEGSEADGGHPTPGGRGGRRAPYIREPGRRLECGAGSAFCPLSGSGAAPLWSRPAGRPLERAGTGRPP